MVSNVDRGNEDSFKLYSQTVQSVNTVWDLGVQFCSNLTFTSHINTFVAKAHARTSLIHKCFFSKPGRDHSHKGICYLCALHPKHLSYGR